MLRLAAALAALLVVRLGALRYNATDLFRRRAGIHGELKDLREGLRPHAISHIRVNTAQMILPHHALLPCRLDPARAMLYSAASRRLISA
jgi:hypothetical protein